MTAPDWLTLHAGSLKTGLSSHTVFVLLEGEPQYRLDIRPAGGQFACNVTQTVNGHRYDAAKVFANEAAALVGGLDALRKQLGW